MTGTSLNVSGSYTLTRVPGETIWRATETLSATVFLSTVEYLEPCTFAGEVVTEWIAEELEIEAGCVDGNAYAEAIVNGTKYTNGVASGSFTDRVYCGESAGSWTLAACVIIGEPGSCTVPITTPNEPAAFCACPTGTTMPTWGNLASAWGAGSISL